MDWREVYKLPFRYDGMLYVLASNRTTTLTFDFDHDENFATNIVNKLNGDSSIKFDSKFTIKNNIEFYYNDKFTFVVRGWGKLIGYGGFRLSETEAIQTQNDFANWILEILNN